MLRWTVDQSIPDVVERPGALTAVVDQVREIYAQLEISAAESRTAFAVRGRSLPSRIVKRTVDLVAGTILCLLTSVVVLGLMVGAAISFKAMPLFAQQRVGRYGRQFRMLKIRSLPTQAPTDVDKYQLEGVLTSGFGRFIRATHLDELPQLWLVLCGRMSLVGPRPDMPSILSRFDQDHLSSRSPLCPGCTGLWQISPAIVGMIYEAPEYDLFYAEQMCVRLDLWILWHTVLQRFGGSKQTLDDVPRWVCAHPVQVAFQRTSPRAIRS